MSSALFSSAGQAKSKNLVEFKAGKMTLKGKMVQPDKRKGLIYIYQSEDSLMHFCWKDRTSGTVEDDLMMFPDDFEIRKIIQCTTGRVYLLKFKSSNKKLFFWMQEPETDKDEKLWKKVTDYLNNPPPPGSATSSSNSVGDRAGSSAGTNPFFGDLSSLGSAELQTLLSNMNEQQLQMFFGNLPFNSPSSNRSGSSLSSNQTSRVQSTVPGSRAEPASSTSNLAPSSGTASASVSTSGNPTVGESKPVQASDNPDNDPAIISSKKSDETASSSSSKIQLSDLQNILGNLGGFSSDRSELDLSELVSLDVMAPILTNKSIQEKLMQYLPESDILPKTEQELKSTFTTPQFKKAMSSFGAALQSGQLGPLMKQFDLPEEVTIAAAQGNLEAFAKAMEAHSQSKKEKKPTNEEEENQMDTK